MSRIRQFLLEYVFADAFKDLDTQYPVPVQIGDGVSQVSLENDTVPVTLQNKYTSTLILPLVQELAEDTLAADTVIGAYTVTLTSVVGFSIGNHFRIINALADRYYFGTILGIVGNVLTLDTQIDFVYLSTSEVTASNRNMTVDGSGTPILFRLRTGSPSIPSSVDITRIIFSCTCLSAVDLSLFGDLPALTRGLALRRTDGNGGLSNIFNVKSNQHIACITYSWSPFAATNPVQGVDGFTARLSFAGQDKLGVALRIGADENLEALIQDDLTGLTTLCITVEGHVV